MPTGATVLTKRSARPRMLQGELAGGMRPAAPSPADVAAGADIAGTAHAWHLEPLPLLRQRREAEAAAGIIRPLDPVEIYGDF